MLTHVVRQRTHKSTSRASRSLITPASMNISSRGYRVPPARSAILSGTGSVADPARGGQSKDAPGRSFNALFNAPPSRLHM